MALTRDYPPFEDPGGRKGAALRKAGFLYEFALDVFAYRAAGKIAVRTAVEGRSIAELKRFIDRSTPSAWQISNLRREGCSYFSRRETFLPDRVGLAELAQCRRLGPAFHTVASR